MTNYCCANLARRLAIIALILLIAAPALAAKVGSVVRVKGSETSELVGMGPGRRARWHRRRRRLRPRPTARWWRSSASSSTTRPPSGELDDAKSVALVALSATIPAEGVAEGDKLDVYVSTVGPAKSLEGGRLFLIPMVGEQADSDVLALASGEVTLENPEVPTTGRNRRVRPLGCQDDPHPPGPVQSTTAATSSSSSTPPTPRSAPPPTWRASSTAWSRPTGRTSPGPSMRRTSTSAYPSTSGPTPRSSSTSSSTATSTRRRSPAGPVCGH